jgi:hypothetical protein
MLFLLSLIQFKKIDNNLIRCFNLVDFTFSLSGKVCYRLNTQLHELLSYFVRPGDVECRKKLNHDE